MEKISKKDLAEKLAEEKGLTKKLATEYVEAVFGAVIESLKEGKEVAVKDLGTLKVKVRPAREGINPATKEKIKIAAKKVVAFKQASNLEIK